MSATSHPSQSAIADPRAYLQERVALFARVVATFFLCGGIMSVIVYTLGGSSPFPTEDLAMWFIAALFGGAWLYTRRAVALSMPKLRAVELMGTLLGCVIFGVGMPHAPAPFEVNGWGTVMLWVGTGLLGWLIVLRAGLVPSPWQLTLGVGAVGAALLAFSGYRNWDVGALIPGLSAPQTGALHCGAMMMFLGAVTAAISKVTWGLQQRVRAAMQLGQYTLLDKIGEGGMGQVYRAKHAMLQRPTAVKLLPVEKSSANAITRFEHEVQHTSRLTHPNTVAIFDFGHTPDGVFYYAMEYLGGLSLEELIDLDGPQPAARVLHIIAQAADALAEAHAMKLIHRAVKPANIVLCSRGGIDDVVKVLDFGLVKDIQAPKDAGLSVTATITGTPETMAPESLTDPSKVDGRTDLYGLGAVAYHLLAGEPVFTGKTVVEVCGHHMHTDPKPISEHVEVDADVEAVVLKCLAKDQAERPQSAGELRDALLSCEAANRWSRADAKAWWASRADAIEALAAARLLPASDERAKPTKSVVQ
jgi:serine/threonine-protein kinase